MVPIYGLLPFPMPSKNKERFRSQSEKMKHNDRFITRITSPSFLCVQTRLGLRPPFSRLSWIDLRPVLEERPLAIRSVE